MIDYQDITNLDPENIKTYISNRGWVFRDYSNEQQNIGLFEKNGEQIVLPFDKGFKDYARRVYDLIKTLAELESTKELTILSEVKNISSDIIKFRLFGDALLSGTLPATDAVDFYQASKKLMLASACQTLDPKTYYRKLSKSEADQFISGCSFGQTERGSYVVSIICPLYMGITTNTDNSPFTRKVTTNLYLTLKKLVNALTDRREDEMLLESPFVSSNFCDALVVMSGAKLSSNIDFKFSWSSELSDNTIGLNKEVTLRADFIPRIQELSKKLKPDILKNDTFISKVERLQGEPDENGLMHGDVILAFVFDDELVRAKVFLNSSDYKIANKAHMDNSYLSITGQLKRGPRIGVIDGPSDIQLINPASN